MKNNENILDHFIDGGKWFKTYRAIWFALAFIITIYLGFQQLLEPENLWWMTAIFVVTALLGYFCVSSLADRSPLMGNVLGLASNIGEVFTQLVFGNVGMACAAIYYGITHVLGFFTWTDKKNQTDDGKIMVSNLTKMGAILTLVFTVIGIFVVSQYGAIFNMDTTNSFIYWMNIIAFVVGILAQFTMIMRKPFSWVLWAITNVIWFTLNVQSGNYIFAAQSVLYEVNAVLAIYAWYKAANVDNNAVTTL